MVRIGKLTDYGVLIMSHLASNPDEPQSAYELAGELKMPQPTVSKILKALAHAGLLQSQRGVKGGYHLSRSPAQISLIEIIDALEGPLALTECNLQAGLCEMECDCNMRKNWIDINALIRNTLAKIDLAQMSEQGSFS